MKHVINSIVQNLKNLKKTTDNKNITEVDVENSEVIIESTNISDSKYNMHDFLKFWIAGLMIVFLGYMAYGIMDTLYLIVLGFVLSVAMEANISRFKDKKISRGWGIAISYILLIGFLITGVLVIIPFLATQISDLTQIFIQHFNTVQGYINSMGVLGYINSLDVPEYFKIGINEFANDPQYLKSLQDTLIGSIETITKQVSTYLGGAGSLVLSTVKGFANLLFQVGLIFTAAILFSVDHDNILNYLNKTTHTPKRSYKIKKIYTKIGFRLKSQLLLCLFIFIAVYIGLFILEIFGVSIPNKLSLALISGLTEFIPYVGPILGAVPAIFVGSIAEGWTGFIRVSVLYFIVQRLENNILIPMVMNKTLGVSGVLIFLSVLLCGMAMGIVGVILAIPIAIIISVMSE